MSNKRSNILHLYARAGFGLSADQVDRLEKKSYANVLDQLFADSKAVDLLDFVPHKITRAEFKNASASRKKELRKQNKQWMRDLSISWLLRLPQSKSVLREKMTLFWHGHFACRSDHPWLAQHLNNEIRTHALGSFRDLLIAVSKAPAMLEFLNNKQNRKKAPNENFARELLELFTMGVGHYSETDIQQAARAFTGWNYDEEGVFLFKERQHDFGDKTFLGETGRFSGEDIVDIILKQEQTAVHLSSRIYRYFVNHEVDAERVLELAEVMRGSDYDIAVTMRHLFNAKWFFDSENVGTKIKSPAELLAGLHLHFDINWEKPENIIYLQKLLGQVLLLPPNVAGWPGGRRWIDSTTLMARLRLPSALLNGGVIGLEWDESADLEAVAVQKSKMQRKLHVSADWSGWLKRTTERDQVQELLLRSPISEAGQHALADLNQLDIKEYTLAILSLPEYQLC